MASANVAIIVTIIILLLGEFFFCSGQLYIILTTHSVKTIRPLLIAKVYMYMTFLCTQCQLILAVM